MWTVKQGGRYASVRVISPDHHAVSHTVVKLFATVVESALLSKIPQSAIAIQATPAVNAGTSSEIRNCL